MNNNRQSRPGSLRAFAFGSRRRVSSSPAPPSPTLSEATNASTFNFGPSGPSKIITRHDLKSSVQAYEDLMTTSANYRAALIAMSSATSAFASAMQACSGLKGSSYEAATRLQVASGLHHLIGNQWHVLAETLDKNFEKPLQSHLQAYRSRIQERSSSYERALREKSQVIKDTEARNLNRKQRNLQTFRENLAVMQRQVEELDQLKAAHYTEIEEHEEEVWNVVQSKVCLEVRSSMDVFEKFTSKASDPIIEPMLLAVPDAFDAYGPPQAEDQIFSILAPLSINTQPPSSSTTSLTRSNSDLASSWLTNVSNGLPYDSHLAESSDEMSPTSVTDPSASPPTPGAGSGRHKQTSSFSQKKDSTLRKVLSSINESQSHRGADNSNLTPKADAEHSSPWSLHGDGHSSQPSSDGPDRDRTPRNSLLFVPQATQDTDPPIFERPISTEIAMPS